MRGFSRAIVAVCRPRQGAFLEPMVLARRAISRIASDQARLIGSRCCPLSARNAQCDIRLLRIEKILKRQKAQGLLPCVRVNFAAQDFAYAESIRPEMLGNVVVFRALKLHDPRRNSLFEGKLRSFDRDRVQFYAGNGASYGIHGVTSFMDASDLPFGYGWQVRPGGSVRQHATSARIIPIRSRESQAAQRCTTPHLAVDSACNAVYMRAFPLWPNLSEGWAA